MTKALLTVCAVLATSMAFAAEGPQDRWNLGDIYASREAWQADAGKLQAQLKAFSSCRGHLGDSARRLKSCMDAYSDLSKRYARLDVYASEFLSEDTGVPESLELSEKARLLGAQREEAISFLKPEILKLGRARVAGFLAEEKSLGDYRQEFDRILRLAPHTLDREGEALVAKFDRSQGAADSVFSILSNSELPWPTVRLSDGKEVLLDQSAYTQYREAHNRDDRKKVFDAFWGAWKKYERTFGVTLHESLKKDAVYTSVRKYPDTLTRALDRERIPVAVYDTLIAEANKGLPTLHRYFRLRAKMLGIQDGMRYYDVYPPLVQSSLKYPLEDGKKMVLEAVKPLGSRYVSTMASGFANRWMDAYPRAHKQSGAHMDGAAYDVHPYVLMNYNDNYESVSTLAHEWGHALHSSLSNSSQSFLDSSYATFVAEIASTFNEELLLEHALQSAKSDEERLLYLGSALEGLRATFFRQAMFAEFERDIHARVDRGETLSGKKLSEIYGDILRRYHGEREGVVKIDDLYTVEWAYIPHFYYTFYVFQYATSIAASSKLAEAVLKGEPGAREGYIKLLSAGGSNYPYELVKEAGVDLATAAPYRAVIARMNRIMDDIEGLRR